MDITSGRKPRLVDDDDDAVESSRIDNISIEELRQLLDDSPTDELEIVPGETDQ